MIDQLGFYLELGMAFTAGAFVMGALSAIGNSFARIGVTFRPDRDASFFDGGR
jgi:hypothetical protein